MTEKIKNYLFKTNINVTKRRRSAGGTSQPMDKISSDFCCFPESLQAKSGFK
jgi:hypothetical protein